MEFKHWLDSWAEVKTEFERLGDEDREAARARNLAAGSSRIPILVDGGEKAIAYAEEQRNRLLDLLNQHEREWRDELAGFAAALTQEVIEQTFPGPAQWQALRGIVSYAKLSPEAVMFVVEMHWWDEDDGSAEQFFLQQAPFLTQDLSQSDMQSTFAGFLDEWSGTDLVHPVFSDFFLCRLSNEADALRLPLHAAAVKEYDLAFFEDEITFLNPTTMEQELLALHIAYTNLDRSEDANRVLSRLDDLAADGVVAPSLYEALSGILADPQEDPSADQESLKTALREERQKVEDALIEVLGHVWQGLHATTRQWLIQAGIDHGRDHDLEFCRSAQAYHLAIQVEWRHQAELWSRKRLSEKTERIIESAVEDLPEPETDENAFVTQCPNHRFLYAETTLDVLVALRLLRNNVTHNKNMNPRKVRDIVERLWENRFLRHYFEALVAQRRSQPDAE